MSGSYTRGMVVKGPHLLAEPDFRPYVCLSDGFHLFSDEESSLTRHFSLRLV